MYNVLYFQIIMLRYLSRCLTAGRSCMIRCYSDGVKNIPTYHPDNLDKMILVRLKYYKSVADVPHRVDEAMMAKAKSRARIFIANAMILTTILCACITIYFARSNSRTHSLVEENQKRHLAYMKGQTGSGSRIGLVTHSKEDSKEE